MRTHPLSPKAIEQVRKARAEGFKVFFVEAEENPAKIVAHWYVGDNRAVTLFADGKIDAEYIETEGERNHREDEETAACEIQAERRGWAPANYRPAMW